jgi:hypothetical protein
VGAQREAADRTGRARRHPDRLAQPGPDLGSLVSDVCARLELTDSLAAADGSLLPGPHAKLAGPTFEEWLTTQPDSASAPAIPR